jgi:hypothetical protein
MLRRAHRLVTLFALLCLVVSCGDSDKPAGHGQSDAVGQLTGYGECKSGGLAAALAETPTDDDCIEYSHDGTTTLSLTHVNAGFNCCPDTLTAEIRITADSIIISEAELLINPCDCLFDLDYEITNLPPGTYTIRVNELYLQEDDEILEFTVDLSASPSGEHCLSRDHYPWGTP